MPKPQKIDSLLLKQDVVRFSNSYFHVYHEISKQLDESELDQIGNFFSGSLYALKNLIESPKQSNLKIELALNKLKRLVNELVLLQYKVNITRILLLAFLETANKIIEVLEEEQSN